MHKALPKLTVFVVMLVGFLGQAMASSSSVFCNALFDAHTATKLSEPHLAVNKDKLQLSAQVLDITNEAEDCCDTDCCDANCLCLANGCVSVVYLSNQVSDLYSETFRITAITPLVEQPNSLASTLYRPPIFTS